MGAVKIAQVKDRVLKWLENKPSNRDDDHALIANIWMEDLERMGVDKDTARKFCAFIAHNQVTHPESIRRVRAQLQKEHPELRGSKYLLRKGRETEVRSELGYH